MSYDIIIEMEAILVQIKYKWYKLIFATYYVGLGLTYVIYKIRILVLLRETSSDHFKSLISIARPLSLYQVLYYHYCYLVKVV